MQQSTNGYGRNIRRYYLFSLLTNSIFWGPIWIIFLNDRGVSLDQIGMLEVVALFIGALMEVPTGVIADTYGRKVSLAMGAAMNAVAMLAMLTGALSPIFLVGYLLWSISFTFFSGAGEALLYDSLKADGLEDRFTEITGRNMTFIQAAGGVAGLLGGLIAVWDMRACFIVTAVFYIVASGIALTLKEPPHADAGEAGEPRPSYRDNLRIGVRIAVHQPLVRYIILFSATLMVFSLLVVGFLVQPYAEEVGIPLWLMGGVMLLTSGGSMAGASLAGRTERRLGRIRLLFIVPAVVVGLHLALGLAASPVAIGLVALVSLVVALTQPVLSTMLNDAIPSAQRATVLSLQSLLFLLAASPIQIALLAIATRTSAATAIVVSAIMLAILIVPCFVLLQRAAAEPTVEDAPLVALPLPIGRALAAD
jgi:MFS family permease